MDTRNKILTLAAACELTVPITIASGTFDILRAEHAGELQEVRDRAGDKALLAVVLPSPISLLGSGARAEMVAALRVVDYVITAYDEDLVELSRAHPAAVVVRLEAADACRTRQLIEHVRRRQIL